MIQDAIQFFLIPHRFMHALMREHAVPEKFGLNKTEVRALMALRHYERISMKKLGDGVGMPKGSFTQVIDKLVNAGVAERASNPQDRRMVMVNITSHGKEVATELDEDLRSYMKKKLKALKEKEQEELWQALQTIQKISSILNEGNNENR